MSGKRKLDRFRSSKRLVSYRVLILAAAFVVLTLFWRQVDGEPRLTSGTYPLRHVNGDASLAIVVSGQEVALHWIGIRFADVNAAKAWLESRLESAQRIRVRFDRRRLDETGNLIAYMYENDELLNESLVRSGIATPAAHPSDHASLAQTLHRAAKVTQADK